MAASSSVSVASEMVPISSVGIFDSEKYILGPDPNCPEKVGAATTLTNALLRVVKGLPKGVCNLVISFHSWIDKMKKIYTYSFGNKTMVNLANFDDLVREIIRRFEQQFHESTDHLLMIVEVVFEDGTVYKFAMFSFENSTRSSSIKGAKFMGRKGAFFRIFRTLKEDFGVKIVFTLEGGRDIFDDNTFVKDGVVSVPVAQKWEDFVREIFEQTGFQQVLLSMNNYEKKPDSKGTLVSLSFGIAAFVFEENDDMKDVEFVPLRFNPRNSNGCGCIQVNFGKIISFLIVHFPINFGKNEEENPATHFCEMLQQYLIQNPNVFGILADTNAVAAGYSRQRVIDSIILSVFPVLKNAPSFFSSFVDTVPRVENADGKEVTTRDLRARY